MISDYLAPAYARARSQPALTASAVLAVTGCADHLRLLLLQYVLLILPCQLCLEQRISYYTMVPLAAFALARGRLWRLAQGVGLGFIAIMAIMLWNTGLSIFHAGVEYKFWQGPTDCSGPITSLGSASTLINGCRTSLWSAATRSLGACSASPWPATTRCCRLVSPPWQPGARRRLSRSAQRTNEREPVRAGEILIIAPASAASRSVSCCIAPASPAASSRRRLN